MKFFEFSIFFIFLTSFKALYSQSDIQQVNLVQGVIIDNSTEIEIPFANIFNENKRTLFHAQKDGSFSIVADKRDTLVVSAIGYFSELVFLSDTLSIDSLIIKLESRSYEIREAVITIPKKYSQFKQDVLNLKLPKTELDKLSEDLTETSKQVIIEAEYDRMVNEVFAREKGTLFVLGTSIKTRNEKNKKKFKKVLSKEEEQKLIDAKFNRKMVKSLTKLPDNEITDFIVFCNFKPEFILYASEYEIIKLIYEKLEEYKNSNL